MRSLTINGPAVRRTRELAGLTVRDVTDRMLAEGVKVDPGYIRQIERGVRQPSAPCFKAIVAALECPLESLLDGELEPAA